MDPTQLVAANIRAELGRQRITIRELARRIQMDPSSLHRRTSGQQEITIAELTRIATAIGLTPRDLLGELVA